MKCGLMVTGNGVNSNKLLADLLPISYNRHYNQWLTTSYCYVIVILTMEDNMNDNVKTYITMFIASIFIVVYIKYWHDPLIAAGLKLMGVE